MHFAHRWSPVVLAALLSPALLQPVSCDTSGNASLSSLEVEAAGLNRVVGFSSTAVGYDLWTTSGVDAITVRAQTAIPTARVNYRLSASGITSGFLGVGGGELMLTIPVNTSANLTLDVTDGGTRKSYSIDLNPTCTPGVCNDADPCSLDACNTSTNKCEFTTAPDGTVCDFASVGDGVCTAGACTEPDPFCGSVLPLASATLGSSALSRTVPSPDLSKVAFGAGSTLYAQDAQALTSSGSDSLGGQLIRGPAWVTNSGGDMNLFASPDNGSVYRVDASGGSLQVQWERSVQRAGCTFDAADSPPVVHVRESASAAFKSEYATDVIYVGTRYSNMTAGGASCGGQDADNRVYALNADTDSTLWQFNDLGSFSLGRVFGMTLDAENDTLFVATEREASVSQDSVWALDVVNLGAVRWSANYGRIQTAPILYEGRLYIASLTGDVIAIDPTDGSEIWRDGSFIPLNADPVLAELNTGETLIVAVDAFGQIRAVREDGSSGTTVAWFRLPDGTPGDAASFPTVTATSLVAVDPDGRALVGASDGNVYPVNLVAQTVGAPLPVGSPTASVVDVRLEPPGLFGTPSSFLAATSEGELVRYCTTLEPAQCEDGIDNDGDGFTDDADPGCENSADGAETSPTVACDDGLDNDGDDAVDTADTGCSSAFDPSELDALCDSATALVSLDLSPGPASRVAVSPDSTLLTFASSSTLYVLQRDTFAGAGSFGLGGLLATAPVWPETDDGDTDLFVANDTASVYRLRGGPTVLNIWSDAFRRSGCALDSIRSRAVFHRRSTASANYKAAFTTDSLYIGTAYSSVGSGCAGAVTDNRVIALDATTGDIRYTFNSLGTQDVDAVTGMALDPATDTLFVATERTASTSQNSIWAIDVLTGTLRWFGNYGRIQATPILRDERLYVATVAGELKVLDADDGTEIWSTTTLIPFSDDPVLVDFHTGETFLMLLDDYGQVQLVRDEGASGVALSPLPLASGVRGIGVASVDSFGQALVGADDGNVYPVDLLGGVVGTPVAVGSPTATVVDVRLEPEGLFGSPGSFIATTDEGDLVRFCTTLGTSP